ncbi:unnamed protein product, partial [Iphiclides podalirius]
MSEVKSAAGKYQDRRGGVRARPPAGPRCRRRSRAAQPYVRALPPRPNGEMRARRRRATSASPRRLLFPAERKSRASRSAHGRWLRQH